MFMRSAIVSGSNIYIYIYIFEELIFIIGTASSYFIIFCRFDESQNSENVPNLDGDDRRHKSIRRNIWFIEWKTSERNLGIVLLYLCLVIQFRQF